MKWMKQVFAQRYNRETGRTGHIVEKMEICKNPPYGGQTPK
jgi:hypothetical protein